MAEQSSYHTEVAAFHGYDLLAGQTLLAITPQDREMHGDTVTLAWSQVGSVGVEVSPDGLPALRISSTSGRTWVMASNSREQTEYWAALPRERLDVLGH